LRNAAAYPPTLGNVSKRLVTHSLSLCIPVCQRTIFHDQITCHVLPCCDIFRRTSTSRLRALTRTSRDALWLCYEIVVRQVSLCALYRAVHDASWCSRIFAWFAVHCCGLRCSCVGHWCIYSWRERLGYEGTAGRQLTATHALRHVAQRTTTIYPNYKRVISTTHHLQAIPIPILHQMTISLM